MMLLLLTLLQDADRRVLFLTHSAGYEHSVVKRDGDSLSHAERLLTEEAPFAVVATKDCSLINADDLAKYDAVVFYTTGELPIDSAALLEFVRAGGGFVGIHPATDTLYKQSDYGDLVGGYFNGHPWHEKVGVVVEDPTHPAAAHLGAGFEIVDEIYQFRDLRAGSHVILRLDPDRTDMTQGAIEGDAFPLAWTRRVGLGRVFYTALGHREDVWSNPAFMTHLVEGIRWTFGQDDEGFDVIFDGVHTAGWKQAGPGGFAVEDGVARPHGGMGLWYYEHEYENFILKLEFRQEAIGSNSGVYVRFPDPEGDPWNPVKQGYEIQIAGDKPAKNSTGAIYDFKAADEVPLKPAGEWNEYEIIAIGQDYGVRLNGRLINTYTGNRSLRGRIGLQNHDDESIVEYRNVRVKPLSVDAAAYLVLFEGDAKGWRMAGPGEFHLKDGVLTADGGMGLFWHERAFKDFTLLLDWRVEKPENNSGVFVRFPDPGDDPWVAVKEGYEIQICDTADAKHRTGSIYDFKDASDVPTHKPGEWNHYEITVIGQRYTVRVNGKVVNEFEGDRGAEGRVGLQNHDPGSPVSFRNVRVVEYK